MKTLIASALVAVSLIAGQAMADTLDFNEVTVNDYVGGTSLSLSNATITTAGADIFVAGPGTYTPAFGSSGGFCSVTTVSGFDCSTVSTISFNSAVSDLSFVTRAFNGGDIVNAMIYSGTTLLHTIVATSDTTLDFSGFAGVTSLVLDASASTGLGFVYGDFDFNGVPTVPLPASGLMLIVGIGGIAGLRRKKA